MKRKQWVVYGLSLIVLLGLMTGCGGKSETAGGDAAKSQEQEKQAQEELGARLSGQFVDLMTSEEYLMKYRTSMNIEGQAIEVEATVAVSGDNTAVISKTNGMESTMITKDGKSYVIDHTGKTIMILPETPDAQDSGFDGTTGIVNVDSDIAFLGDGKEGNLTYEEYSSMDGTIRYYFDGETFVKMVVTSGGQTMTMEILEFTDTVPEGIFDIPSDYQTINL